MRISESTSLNGNPVREERSVSVSGQNGLMCKSVTPIRDLPLDFVKGILVTVMVIYHVMNYFSTTGPQSFGYVRFVTGSFVFISGYVVAAFYADRYLTDGIKTAGRLFVRGSKLFVLFSILNILIGLTGIGNPVKAPLDIHRYLGNLAAIYGQGRPGIAAFQVLLPISYLLVVSPMFLPLIKAKKVMLTITVAIAVVYSLTDLNSVNLGLGIIGLTGLSAGMLINGSEKSFYLKNRLVTLFCVLMLVGLMGYMDRNVLAYSTGIMVLLKLLYDFGRTVNSRNRIWKVLVLFGQYSLICYIIQIVFLQGLSRLLARQKWGLGLETVSIFMATIVFLLMSCLLIKSLRSRFEWANKAYRFIFS
jgi:peptidoglycan/LPS O-acetylase OafA/YrhL